MLLDRVVKTDLERFSRERLPGLCSATISDERLSAVRQRRTRHELARLTWVDPHVRSCSMRVVSKKGQITSSTTYGDAGSWSGSTEWMDDLDAGLKSRRERGQHQICAMREIGLSVIRGNKGQCVPSGNGIGLACRHVFVIRPGSAIELADIPGANVEVTASRWICGLHILLFVTFAPALRRAPNISSQGWLSPPLALALVLAA